MTTGRRRRRRRLATVVAAAVLAAGVAFAAWVGWLSPVLPWQEATGWDRIPPDERPASAALWPGDDPPELAWLGHAGFLLRWHGETVLVDPNLDDHCTVAKRILENPMHGADLGPADAVLISHAHFDHLDLPTLQAVSEIGTIVLPRGSDAYLGEDLRRRARIVGLAEGDDVRIGPLEVVAVHAAHNGNRFHPLASAEKALGYVVRDAAGDALYFAGDTGYGPHFAEIGRRYRPRVAVLPIGAYSPRAILAPYHLSPEEAVTAARDLGVETVVPAHFGTFTLFLDRPSAALPRFAAAAHAAGLRWVMPALLRELPGGAR